MRIKCGAQFEVVSLLPDVSLLSWVLVEVFLRRVTNVRLTEGVHFLAGIHLMTAVDQ